MVYDAVHNVIGEALGDLDPSSALQDFHGEGRDVVER